MRISDWSSDVCSSDLRLRLPRVGGRQHDARRVDDIDVPVALTGQPGALRIAEQPLARFVALRLLADEEADLAAGVRQLADRDVVVGAAFGAIRGRSEERWGGKVGDRSCKSRWESLS